MINDHVFSQGIIPEMQQLVRRVGEILNDQNLIRESEKYALKKPAPQERKELIVFFSPACPYCNQLTSFLDANQIAYTHKNVMQSEAALEELRQLTGKMTIPVMTRGNEMVVGFDKPRIRDLLKLDPQKEQDGQYLYMEHSTLAFDSITKWGTAEEFNP